MKTRRPEGSSPALPPIKTESTKAASQPQPAPPTSAAPPPASSFQQPSSSSPTALTGATKGYVSPTQVESPFTPEEKQQLSKKIPCPALSGMFNAGMLKVAKDGT